MSQELSFETWVRAITVVILAPVVIFFLVDMYRDLIKRLWKWWESRPSVWRKHRSKRAAADRLRRTWERP